jgi:ubiquinone/menaquinone biosynthesis C-methylase UbiE
MEIENRPNQSWWLENGRWWYEECQRRRRAIPYYMIQEAFLSGYFSAAGPCRVLEFGCGFGRHLSYLRQIAGLDLEGCDPSPSMLAIAGEMLPADWFAKQVKLIQARGKLPYRDKSFDIVFSASVLIHVHPEDVGAVIDELLRVARGHILHIENPVTDQAVLTCGEHNGCWAHPLKAVYAERGINLEFLPPHGTLQAGYRASLDGAAMPDISALAGRLFEMESFLNAARVPHALDADQAQRIAETDRQLAEQAQLLANQHQRIIDSETRVADLSTELADLQTMLEKQAENHAAQLAMLESDRIELEKINQKAIEELNDRISQTRRSLADALRNRAAQAAAESAFHQRLQASLHGSR